MGQELELLYQALAARFGVVVATSNMQLALGRLYAARKKSGDPALDGLTLRRSPFNPHNELWIVKTKELSGDVAQPAE